MRQGVTPTPVCSPVSPRITCTIRAHTWSQPHPSPLRSPQQSCCAWLYSFTVGGRGVLLSVTCESQLSHTYIWIRSNCFWMPFSWTQVSFNSSNSVWQQLWWKREAPFTNSVVVCRVPVLCNYLLAVTQMLIFKATQFPHYISVSLFLWLTVLSFPSRASLCFHSVRWRWRWDRAGVRHAAHVYNHCAEPGTT